MTLKLKAVFGLGFLVCWQILCDDGVTALPLTNKTRYKTHLISRACLEATSRLNRKCLLLRNMLSPCSRAFKLSMFSDLSIPWTGHPDDSILNSRFFTLRLTLSQLSQRAFPLVLDRVLSQLIHMTLLRKISRFWLCRVALVPGIQRIPSECGSLSKRDIQNWDISWLSALEV